MHESFPGSGRLDNSGCPGPSEWLVTHLKGLVWRQTVAVSNLMFCLVNFMAYEWLAFPNLSKYYILDEWHVADVRNDVRLRGFCLLRILIELGSFPMFHRVRFR